MKLKSLLVASMVSAGLMTTNVFAAEKVEFWTMSLKPKFIPYFQNLVKNYETQNPDVHIEWVDFPWDVIQARLATAMSAGTPPGLVNLNVQWAEEYARDGKILPVDGIINRETYGKGAIDDLTFKGKVYGFPHYTNVNVIAYNTKLFKEAGLTKAPGSLDELLDDSVQIAAKTGKAGYAPTLGKIDSFFLQQGLDVIKDGKAAFNSPKHVELLNKLAVAYKARGLLRDNLFAEDSFPYVIDAYMDGRLAMLVSTPSALGNVKSRAKEIYAVTDIFPAPLGPTGIADGGWLFHFAVPKGNEGKHLAAVGKFAQYLNNDENQLAFSKVGGTFPATLKAADDPYFQKLPDNAGALEKAIAVGARNVKNARTLYTSVTPELRHTLVLAVEAAVRGKKDPKLALDEAAAIWDKQLAKPNGAVN
jgi:putative chitobiose transport system substrate-binding protein